MCGIFALLNNDYSYLTRTFIESQFLKGKGRGPEHSVFRNVMLSADFGFHRLAINGLNSGSNQPIIINDIALICNGEIYNYKQLYKEMKVDSSTDSDCEIIIHLYLKYGIDHTLQMLDGVFSFVLIDYRLSNRTGKIYVARDPYGVRPLYMMRPNKIMNKKRESLSLTTPSYNNCSMYAFASELKMLNEILYKLNDKMIEKSYNLQYEIEQFQPGTYSSFDIEFTVNPTWRLQQMNCSYHNIGFYSNIIDNSQPNISQYIKGIQNHLRNAVEKRCCTTERPIACLLSGGLDSSLIAALVNDFHVKNGLPTIETYSIGLPDSEDLKHARMVADHLGTKHTEILLTEQDFLDAIPEVIKSIESYDTTTVRASIGNWLLGKYISENSVAKVIFNGDGSDELAGGYLYMNYAHDVIEFDKECRRLLKDIYAFDVLRSDKSISSHGLEPRTPFLDRAWTQYYMSIPAKVRFHKESNVIEKSLIRVAFQKNMYTNSVGGELLPESVLMRRKEAFSDGVSKTSRSLYEIIQEFTDKKFMEEDYTAFSHFMMTDDIYEKIARLHPDMQNTDCHLLPKTSEQYYYRKIFEQNYKGMGKIVPYFWMPKYVNATDASARTLDIYNQEETEP